MMMLLAISWSFMTKADSGIGDDPQEWFKIKFKIHVSLEFGRKPDCKGFGICYIKLNFFDGPGGLGKNQANAEAYFDQQDHLVLDFLKEYLGSETKSVYFPKSFIMEEDYEVPREILEKLKYYKPYVIKAGSYEYAETEERITVKF